MNDKQKTIDIILEEFLQNEVAVTDERILSIRRFMNALSQAVAGYSAKPDSGGETIGKETLAKLIDDMAAIYSEELAQLAVKRNKIYNHLTSVHVAVCNGESARSRLHIN